MTTETDGGKELIEAVQKIARFWEATAQATALDAVRTPGKKETQEAARLYLAKHDACLQMADKVIDAIYRHWPEKRA